MTKSARPTIAFALILALTALAAGRPARADYVLAFGQADYANGGFAQHFDAAGTPIGLEYIDFAHPWNPGDVLHFGADTNPWHANHHNETRLGEFLLYDEYDPRREIRFDASGKSSYGVYGQSPWLRPYFSIPFIF